MNYRIWPLIVVLSYAFPATVYAASYSFEIHHTCTDDSVTVSVSTMNGNKTGSIVVKKAPLTTNLDGFMPEAETRYRVEVETYNVAGPSCGNFTLARTESGSQSGLTEYLQADGSTFGPQPHEFITGGTWNVGVVGKLAFVLSRASVASAAAMPAAGPAHHDKYSFSVNNTCIDDKVSISIVDDHGKANKVAQFSKAPARINLDPFLKDVHQDVTLQMNLYNIAGPSCHNFQMIREHSDSAGNSQTEYLQENGTWASSEFTFKIDGGWWIGNRSDTQLKLNPDTGSAVIEKLK